jgi:TetR/AcrR family transcriptional repressor of uid operon
MGSPLAELLRNGVEPGVEGDPADRVREKILDAAVLEAAAVGIDRLRVEEVARRSGVARMTLYRRFPLRDDLVSALMLRETQRFLAAVAAGIDRTSDPQAGVAEAFVAGVRFSRDHPMLSRVLPGDRGTLTDLVAADDAAILGMGSVFIARQIHGDAPGTPSRHARWVADVLARLFLSYLAIPPDDPDPADDAALRRFARDVLTPLIETVR